MSSLKERVKNVYYFLQGNINYFLYYRDLLPLHIKEQIHYRVAKIRSECFQANQCLNKSCGCHLVKVLMSNKLCIKESCKYTKFKSKRKWEKLLNINKVWTKKIKEQITLGKSLLKV